MTSISYTKNGIFIRSGGDAKTIVELAKSYLIRGYSYDRIREFPKYNEIFLTKL